MRTLNRITSIFQIASHHPKVLKGYGLGRGQCNGSRADLLMKINYNYMLSTAVNIKEMSSCSDPEGKLVDIEDFGEESIDEVKELFRLYFYSREPQSMMLNFTYEDHKELLHDSIKEWITNRVSVLAKDRQTGMLVGCGLASIVNRDKSSSSSRSSDNASNSKYKLRARYNLLLNDIPKKSVDLFKKYDVETILQMGLATVVPTYGNRGLAGLILRERERRGKIQGCQLATVIASNVFSQKYFRSNGYTVEGEAAFAEMRIDGKQVLDLSKSHGTATSQFLIKRLL